MEKKKVLIITYYWPPAGGPGVQRWLKFVKYLPEFNIDPIVYIPENPNYPLVDESLLEEVSSQTTIIKGLINEPYRWASLLSKTATKTISKGVILEDKKQSFIERIMLYVRGNFFIPDARVGWVNPSVNYLLDYIKKENIKTIITTGPPHSVHLIGMKLKAQVKAVKWLADFRDPWTTIGYHKQLKLTKRSKSKHKILEQQVLSASDQIIVTSCNTKKMFSNMTATPIEVITNGYDNEPNADFKMDSKFTMAHIGSLLSKRNPEVLWQVLSDLVNTYKDFASDFQLRFVGFVSNNVMLSLKKKGLSNYIDNRGYVSHKQSVVFQKKSQILLLIEIDSEETKSIIPGKLFEYMVSGRPIISIGPRGSDVENILDETNTGNYFSYGDYESLKRIILEHYNAFQKNKLHSNPIGLQKYHRKALTKSLSKLI